MEEKRLYDLENKVEHMWFVPGMSDFLEAEQNFIKETQKTPNIPEGILGVFFNSSSFLYSVLICCNILTEITFRDLARVARNIKNISQKYNISFLLVLLEPPTQKRINLLRVIHMMS